MSKYRGWAARTLFALYCVAMFVVAIPIVVLIHVWGFAKDLEETWVLWLADWARRNKKDVP